MVTRIRTAFLLSILLLPSLCFAQHKGDIVVAVLQAARLEPATEATPFPGLALRGERWEVVAAQEDKVILTFGPNDERRALADEIGRSFSFEVKRSRYQHEFVPLSQWPARRQDWIARFHIHYPELSLNQLEKMADSQTWIGMTRNQASWSVQEKIIHARADRANQEIWYVGAYKSSYTVPSDPAYRWLEEKAGRKWQDLVRITLFFEDEIVVDIVRK